MCFSKHRPGCQFISESSTGFQSLAGFPRSVYHCTIAHTLECVGDLLLCLEELHYSLLTGEVKSTSDMTELACVNELRSVYFWSHTHTCACVCECVFVCTRSCTRNRRRTGVPPSPHTEALSGLTQKACLRTLNVHTNECWGGGGQGK